MTSLTAVSVVLLAGMATATSAQSLPPPESPASPAEEIVQPALDGSGLGKLDGRHRLELGVGYAEKGGAAVRARAGHVVEGVGTENVSFALGYGYWFRPHLAVNLRVTQLNAAVESAAWNGSRNEVYDVFSLLVGLRREFPRNGARVRPFLAVGLGPYFGSSVLNRVDGHGVVNTNRTLSAFGGQVGGGVDVQVSRRIMLGVRADYDFMSDFSSPVGGRVNYSGIEAGVSLSFLLGRGNAAPQEPAAPAEAGP